MDGNKIAFDASTLILLGRISLLREVAKKWRIVVTAQVFREATRKVSEDAVLIQRLGDEKLLEMVDKGYESEGKTLRREFRIAEEATVLALAHRNGIPVATDDGQAIRAARAIGVEVVTAPSFLVRLVESGAMTVELGLTKLEELGRIGRYSPEILAWVRKRVKGGG